jgi:hypothetical protein
MTEPKISGNMVSEVVSAEEQNFYRECPNCRMIYHIFLVNCPHCPDLQMKRDSGWLKNTFIEEVSHE